jgi:hypothetical protein
MEELEAKADWKQSCATTVLNEEMTSNASIGMLYAEIVRDLTHEVQL